MRTQSVVLRSTSDASGTRHLEASILPSGALRIEGQDIGRGVSDFFGGFDEYEWAWTIEPDDLPQLAVALGAGSDMLEALRSRFSNASAAGLQPFLDEHAIPYETWSRLGG